MLIALSLHSFALIPSVKISFDRGLHVLTGETGAGKTLLVQAIHLLTGHKVSHDLIRRGAEKALLEATFDLQNLPIVQRLLEEGGIDVDPSELLIIKREVAREGKNRILINGQPAPLFLLSKIGPHLIELISQNSAQCLRDQEVHGALLDDYLRLDLDPFAAAYKERAEIEQEIKELEYQSKNSKLPHLKLELDEWSELDYQEGEEEELFAKYKELISAQKEAETITEVRVALDDSELIPTLVQLSKKIEDPEVKESFKSAISHLQEASFKLSKGFDSSSDLEENLEKIEKRLSKLNHLKRKYHVESLSPHLSSLREEIDHLEELDERLKLLKNQRKGCSDRLSALADQLTESRTQGAKKLEKALTLELQQLNLPHASALIKLSKKDLGPKGQDQITFFLAPNRGEEPSSLLLHSSGGEVARFFFAYKLLLRNQESLPTFIFDEIDANMGGETAYLLGKKLKALATGAQVLAITHFPQVAKSADHHYKIAKHELEGRTLATISLLSEGEKAQELQRMLGGLEDLLPQEKIVLASK